ncbi:MAG: hypothetical protein HYZ83_02985 [Candidatus Omnitrophica bacterium]|nr:hypothetical protein [Candidatus Omnitrophota bacterium]
MTKYYETPKNRNPYQSVKERQNVSQAPSQEDWEGGGSRLSAEKENGKRSREEREKRSVAKNAPTPSKAKEKSRPEADENDFEPEDEKRENRRA